MEYEILNTLQQIKDLLQSRPDYTIFTSFLTVVGMIGAAWLAARFQLKSTKMVIAAEMEKNIKQLQLEYAHKEKEKKREVLRAAVEDFVVLTDPDLYDNGSFDSPKIVRLIHRIQILCSDQSEVDLNIRQASTKIGLIIRDSQRAGSNPTEDLLTWQGKLIDNCAKI